MVLEGGLDPRWSPLGDLGRGCSCEPALGKSGVRLRLPSEVWETPLRGTCWLPPTARPGPGPPSMSAPHPTGLPISPAASGPLPAGLRACPLKVPHLGRRSRCFLGPGRSVQAAVPPAAVGVSVPQEDQHPARVGAGCRRTCRGTCRRRRRRLWSSQAQHPGSSETNTPSHPLCAGTGWPSFPVYR